MQISDEVKELIRFAQDHIRHEDGLVNHRLSWFLSLQGLLLAALGLVVRDASPRFLMVGLCIAGVASALSVGYALRVSHRVLELRHKWLEQAVPTNSEGALAPFISAPSDRFAFLFPWRLLPGFFALLWIGLGIWAVFR